jgi:DNA-binding transcriptional MerR regulator
MKIAELSARSATTIASIKFYLREGLLPAGAVTGRNQADYGEEHVRRLRLIRALIDVGGLSVSDARGVLAVVDDQTTPPHQLLGAASYGLYRSTRRNPADPVWQAAREEVLDLVQARGWYVEPTSPGIDQAADAIAAFRALGQDDMLTMLPEYAEVAQRIAATEVGLVLARTGPAAMVEGVVTGTVIGEALLNALRRLAQQDASARRLVDPADLHR